MYSKNLIKEKDKNNNNLKKIYDNLLMVTKIFFEF